MDRQVHILSVDTHRLTDVLRQSPGTDIRRGRLYTRLRKHKSTSFFGFGLVLLDHASNPWYLAGHVNVVSARFSTSSKGIFAIEGVGAHSGDEDKRLLDKFAQLLIVVDAGKFDC